MKKQFFAFALILLAAFTFTSCEELFEPDSELCAAYKVAADLFMTDDLIYEGQKKQNLLIHNIRTGEVFFGGESPVHGFQFGDWLEIGVVIANDYLDNQCSSGMDAPTTYTAPQAVRRSANGQISQQDLSLAFTESIKQGDNGLSIATMQFNAPGDYYFNFEANNTRLIEEHSFSNNDYSSDSNPYGGLTGSPDDNRTVHIHIPASAATDDRSTGEFITEMPDSGTKAAFEKSKLVNHFRTHLKSKISMPVMPQNQ